MAHNLYRRAKILMLAILSFTISASSSVISQPFAGQYLPFHHRVDYEQARFIRDGYAGVALFDYDKDSDLDIFLSNGPGFLNGFLGNQGGQFVEVAEQAGVNASAGMGVVSGDINNDGFDDLFVADVDGNTLYRNQGNGQFVDVTAQSGLTAGDQRSYSAALCDFDLDGLLDVYVGTSRQGPLDQSSHNLLFHNQGNLEFKEIAIQAGVANPVTRMTVEPETELITLSWAVTCFDYDLDGDSDLLVAVDFSTVTLFHNQWQERGTLTFANRTLDAGLGAVGNWMGLAVADYNADGWPDVFVTNWGNSELYPINPLQNFPVDTLVHALYLNNKDGTFSNRANQAGLSDWEIGWGASPLDWDNDGDMDLFFAGNYAEAPGEEFLILDNPGRLFLNDGQANFQESAKEFGLINLHPDGGFQYAHGVAVGDLNNDGYTDIVIANSGYQSNGKNVSGIPIYFQNNAAKDHSWVKVNLIGTRSNFNGIGAKVTIHSGELSMMREVRSGSSHLSQDSRTLTFGVGDSTELDQIEIKWPSGIIDQLKNIPANQTLTIIEGASAQ